MALSLLACVAAGRPRVAKSRKALLKQQERERLALPELVGSRYIRPIKTRIITMIRMMPSPPPG